ncbi:hypothetical protein XU18_4530 [Perkinsela sp. CCAP 1560/4]|nr:DNA/RNA-binding protein Alba-like protein [Perkinsela sp. CCAP 1560/4]KNH04176.1 hypothetical protein XU18_4530 [Perkinsela sp. CCAP 1560/4]|eukprot:KNH03609.1 DNA/RNA-binding protein Alba-like protein [Perkinsela sp. CCAP 1560/4]
MSQQEITNVVQVSAYKPIFPYIKWAKRLFSDGQEEIEISGLGVSVTSVASIADVLATTNFAKISKINTTRGGLGETRSNIARLRVWMTKSKNFDALFEEENKAREERAKK